MEREFKQKGQGVGMDVEMSGITPFSHTGLAELYQDLRCAFRCENDIVLDPVILRCGHIFCHGCIVTNIAQVNFNN